MQIIEKVPNEFGAYSTPQSWSEFTPPEGYAIIPDSVDMTDFYAYNGFVILTIEAMEYTVPVEKSVPVEKHRQVIAGINEDGTPKFATETYYEYAMQTVDEPCTIDTVTACVPNVEAWEAWKASLPIPKKPEPTEEERIAELEAANVELEDAMCEMDLANEERFVAIEDALCELDKG